MLDCGRKFIPISYLQDLVKIMSYYKMNTLQIHLNDNGFKQYFEHDWSKTYSAFRLESETYPGLAAYDGFYTKKEFIDLQKQAMELGVEIIPEIDVPAHSLAFTQYNPRIGSKKYGMDHLDLFAPETYPLSMLFLKSIWKVMNRYSAESAYTSVRMNTRMKRRNWWRSFVSLRITISIW